MELKVPNLFSVPSSFQNKLQRRLYNLVQSQTFEIVIMVAILLNTVTMTVQHYDQSTDFDTALLVINTFFTVVFLVEAILKLIGLRRAYFNDPWNVFDFIVVVISVAGKCSENTDAHESHEYKMSLGIEYTVNDHA